jgi:hypothetical protein
MVVAGDPGAVAVVAIAAVVLKKPDPNNNRTDTTQKDRGSGPHYTTIAPVRTDNTDRPPVRTDNTDRPRSHRQYRSPARSQLTIPIVRRFAPIIQIARRPH